MQDIEALQRENDAAMREAVEANRLEASLPVAPKRVTFATSQLPWISYEVESIAEATALFLRFVPAPWVLWRSRSFTKIAPKSAPASCGSDTYIGVAEVEDGAPYFECITGVGFSTNEMVFFATHEGRTCKVLIRVANCPIRTGIRAINVSARADNRRYEKLYFPPDHSSTVKWSHGEDCANATYWFMDLPSFWLAMEQYVPD